MISNKCILFLTVCNWCTTNGNKYELQYDYCSNYVDDFDEFQDAVTHKKANGWKSININGEWTDKCPDCLEKQLDK